MNIYKISQNINNNCDTFDCAVVIAENKEDARNMIPQHFGFGTFPVKDEWEIRSWCRSPDDVEVEYIGEASLGSSRSVVVASFNAG